MKTAAPAPLLTRHRTFTVFVRDETVNEFSGIDLDLDTVIRSQLRICATGRDDFLNKTKYGPVAFAAYWDDATIWSGNKILAAIRARPDGTFKVKRFG